jgi:hypothetical protein
MRHDRLLRCIAIGLSLATLPAAHAAGKAPQAVRKLTKPRKSLVEAARSNLNLQIELAEMARAPKHDGLRLLYEHESMHSAQPSKLVEKDGTVLFSEYGALKVSDGGGASRVAEPADLIKLGISSRKDLDDIVAAHLARAARGVKGISGKDPIAVLKKDIDVTRELNRSTEYDPGVKQIIDHHFEVLVPKGLADGHHIELASAGAKGALVIDVSPRDEDDYGAARIRWKQNGQLRIATRGDFERVGVKSAADFTRVASQRLFRLTRVKGEPGDAQAMRAVEAAIERGRQEVSELRQLITYPHEHADLGLIAKSRVTLQGKGAPPIVLAEGKGERLQFAPVANYVHTPIRLVKDGDRYGGIQASVADLRRFGIDSRKAFDIAASHALAAEGK